MPWKPSSVNSDRRYGHAWQKQRAATLRAEPLCRMCLSAGMTVPATVVDHIVPLGDGGTNEQSNLQPLCKRCHDAVKTPSDTAARKRAEQSDIGIICVPLCESLSYGFDSRVVRRLLAPSLGWDRAHRVSLAAAEGVLQSAVAGALPACELRILCDDVRWARLAAVRFPCALRVDPVGLMPRGGAEAVWLAARHSSEFALRSDSESKGTQAERA